MYEEQQRQRQKLQHMRERQQRQQQRKQQQQQQQQQKGQQQSPPQPKSILRKEPPKVASNPGQWETASSTLGKPPPMYDPAPAAGGYQRSAPWSPQKLAPGAYNQYTCAVKELYCKKCRLFLGHAFEDGATTGDTHPEARWRHCVLSLSLMFGALD